MRIAARSLYANHKIQPKKRNILQHQVAASVKKDVFMYNFAKLLKVSFLSKTLKASGKKKKTGRIKIDSLAGKDNII